MTPISTPLRMLRRGLQRGLNLIELMVGVALLALMLNFMIPSMDIWMQNTQIRSAAESILGALQTARAEAVRRNTGVELVLTSVAGGGNGNDWVVRCVAASASATCPGVGQTQTFIEQRLPSEGSPNAVLSVTPSGTSTIAFTGTGRVTPLPASNIVIDVTHMSNTATNLTCVADGGDYRCLRIIVAPGGQARMCDPSLAAPNPRAC